MLLTTGYKQSIMLIVGSGMGVIYFCLLPATNCHSN